MTIELPEAGAGETMEIFHSRDLEKLLPRHVFTARTGQAAIDGK